MSPTKYRVHFRLMAVCVLCVCILGWAAGTARALEDRSFTFDTDGDMLGWTSDNFEKVDVKGGSIVGTTKADCMLTSPTLNIQASEYVQLVFRARSNVSGFGEVFFRNPDNQMSDKRYLGHYLIGDGVFHTYRVGLCAHPEWTGTIAQIRLDLLNLPGAEVAVDCVTLRTTPEDIPAFTFDGDGNTEGWMPGNFEKVEAKDGRLTGVTKFDSQFVSPVIGINAGDYPELVIRARIGKTEGGTIYFSHPGEAMSEKCKFGFPTLGDGQLHDYKINLAAHPEWKGIIAQIRIDLVNSAGVEVAVDSIELKKAVQ